MSPAAQLRVGPSRGSLGRFAAGSAVIAIVLFAYYALTWRSVAGVLAAMDACKDLFCDFRIYYYPMGEAVFHTGMPVDGFLYSPFAAILFAGFPPIGLDASLVAWGILQVVFVALCLLLFRRLVPAGLPIQLLFAALVLSSYPLVLNFVGGQVSMFFIVGLLGMLALATSGRRASVGGLFAFAVGFKFYPALFLAPFVARRDYRSVFFLAAACGVFLFVVPGLLLGFGDALRFYGGLLDQFRDSDWVVANPHSNYLPHVVLRLAAGAGHDAQAWLPLLTGFSFAIAAANMGLIWLIERARLRQASLWSFQVVALTIPFVLKTSWPHDFGLLPFTQALLAWRLFAREEAEPGPDGEDREDPAGAPAGRRGHRRGAVPIALLLVSIVLSNIVFFNLFGDFTAFGYCAFLFWADVMLLAALYLELLPPALRRLREKRD